MPSAEAMASARDAAEPTSWIAPCMASPNAAATEANGLDSRVVAAIATAASRAAAFPAAPGPPA